MDKIIHYCWFGDKEIPSHDQICIASWSKCMPDYEIRIWNEETFDLSNHLFAKQAYENRKYAFVSDYVRAYVLYNYGGLYLDTDYELLKSIDDLVENDEAILGCENSHFIGSAIMYAPKGHWLFGRMLDYYDKTPFCDRKGHFNEIPNTMVITDILEEQGFTRGNSWHNNGVKVFERDFFFPKKADNGQFLITERTRGVHYFNGSWWSDKERSRSNSRVYNSIIRPVLRIGKSVLRKVGGKEYARKIENYVKNKLR